MDRLSATRTSNPGSRTNEEQQCNYTRNHFQISRSAEYFDAKELQAQTGQPISVFGEVVLKELIDNALDACESAGIDPVILIGIATTEKRMRICVSDNGSGISESVLNNILNFETRTSDKAAYKAPTRGAQGNAFKTIIGIPHALGGGRVIIESLGLRHEITATATPAGTIDIGREATEIEERPGTTIYIDMPSCKANPKWYARATALFNPHAFIKLKTFVDIEFTMLTFEEESEKSDVFYKKIADCQKIKPNEPTSAHWYGRGDFNKLVYLQGTQNDIPIGEFVRQFKGLSACAKAKTITSQFKEFRLVSDICRDPIAIESMRLAMQNESKPLQPKALGAIGENNLLVRFNIGGRHWYKQVSGMINNVPYVFEILIAESEDQRYYFGVNHSPTFGDYMRQSQIKAGELWGTGIEGTLDNILNDQHIVIAHLIGIGLPFLDRGKSNLSLPPEMIASISGAVWSVAKVLHKEHQKRIKDASKAEKDREARSKTDENKTTIKAAVFDVLPNAIQAATDNERLPANVRALFYKVRDFIQKLTAKELDYGYFSQDILINYWQEFGRHRLIYNDPRGILYAPHSNNEVQLGTFSVEAYKFPWYEYNKILYIEKKGLWPTIKAANLHKKYDMAVIAGEGYASEAIRVLLEKVQQDCTIYVLHDADPDGYNIARTIQSETRRMPNHNITVIDLGLNIQDAIDMQLQSETFTRKKNMVKDLEFNAIEHEYFQGKLQYSSYGTKKSWICKRIELNAMNAGQLVNYIDTGISQAIEANLLEKKVIPPEEVLLKKAKEKFNDAIDVKVDAFINEQLKIDDLKDELLKAFSDEFDEQEFTDKVGNYLIENEFKTWEDSIQTVVNKKLDDIQEAVEGRITKLVMVSIKEAT
ncbi:MAG: ATP-binding protein [Methylococcaceae bacterium]|jgi:hypothetical protein